MGLFGQFFSSGNFQPHGFCYAWNARLVWLHVISDVLIAASYFAIPVVLLWFARKRRDIPFSWLFLLFGAFIVACGATHLMEVWNLWHAQYWFAGAVKALTAVASVGTAVVLARTIPQLVRVPNLTEWVKANADLEIRIARRTKELRASNEALQQNRETLGLAQRAARMGAWDRDVTTGRSTWTTELEEVFGVLPGTYNDNSQMWPNLVHPDDSAAVDQAVAESLKQASEFSCEFRIIRPDGQQRWISARGNVIRDGTGQPNRMVGINIDITEQKTSRRANSFAECFIGIFRVAERTRDLTNSNNELESFTYSISHDLRAPLRTIDGFSLALLEDCSDKLDEAGKGHLQRIRTAAQRMGSLIDDLLNLPASPARSSTLRPSTLAPSSPTLPRNCRRPSPSATSPGKFNLASWLLAIRSCSASPSKIFSTTPGSSPLDVPKPPSNLAKRWTMAPRHFLLKTMAQASTPLTPTVYSAPSSVSTPSRNFPAPVWV